MKRLGFLALFLVFLAPLMLQANAQEQSISIASHETLGPATKTGGGTSSRGESDAAGRGVKPLANWADAANPLAKLSHYANFESTLPSGNFIYKATSDSVEVWEGSRQLAVMSKDKIFVKARIGSEAGNKVINGETLVPNIKYDVDGYVYTTDNLGRVKNISGDLDDTIRKRLGY